MPDPTLEHIEAKLDSLIEHCATLEKEVSELRADQITWQNERERAAEKNEQARTRVEAMITLLRNLSADNAQQAS